MTGLLAIRKSMIHPKDTNMAKINPINNSHQSLARLDNNLSPLPERSFGLTVNCNRISF